MYGWVWRILPGPWPVRLVLVLALLLALVWALFTYVFPEIAPYMPFLDVDVEADAAGD